EPDHRWVFGFSHRLAALQHVVDLFLQPNARWYSLHGVDVLRPRSQRSLSVWFTRRIPTPLCFYRKSRTSPKPRIRPANEARRSTTIRVRTLLRSQATANSTQKAIELVWTAHSVELGSEFVHRTLHRPPAIGSVRSTTPAVSAECCRAAVI